ncbi:radical SAM protein [bacterium]|nr:radical SAM protein [bacterium]
MKRPIDILRRLPKFSRYLVKKPLFAWQALDNMRRTRRGELTLNALEYAVVMSCNAACPKCSSDKMQDKGRPRLSHEKIRELADTARRLGTYEVNFTGGEPTLDKNLEDIVSYFHPERTFLGLNTHGGFLTPERIRSLAEAGLDLIKFSLDSPDPHEHDTWRGIEGLWKHNFELVDFINREMPGLRSHFCMTATRELVDSGKVVEALKLAKEHDVTIGYVLPTAVGRWDNHREVSLSPEQRARLNELQKDPSVFVHANVGNGPYECPCGVKEIYVNSYGDVIPCPYIQISFGNVKDEPLDAILARMSGWSEFREGASMCRSSEDERFIDTYIEPLKQHPVLPLPFDKHPAIAPEDMRA